MLRIIAQNYVDVSGAFFTVFMCANLATTLDDDKKWNFARKYPTASTIGGFFGPMVAGLLFPISMKNPEKQLYLFGGVPFNFFTNNQWKYNCNNAYLYKMREDHEKAFPEVYKSK